MTSVTLGTQEEIKVNYQRCDINLTSIYSLQDLSGPVILLKRMTSGVLISWRYIEVLLSGV